MKLRQLVAAMAAAGVAAVTACSGPPPLQSAFDQVVHADLARIVEISTPDSIGSGVVLDNKGDIVTTLGSIPRPGQGEPSAGPSVQVSWLVGALLLNITSVSQCVKPSDSYRPMAAVFVSSTYSITWARPRARR
jgi:hypothetical protein